MEPILQNLYDAIMNGEANSTPGLVNQALNQGLPASQILNEGMIAAMNHVGMLFEEGEFFVPEMLIAARAMQAGLAVLKPHLAEAEVKAAGRIVAGTVKGDLHDIGKNLVCMLLEGAGFEIIDLGTDVAPEKFVQVVQEGRADVVALSALLTTTMPNMKATIEALNNAGVRGNVKVMIGGAPVTQAYADQIGADGYAPDASRAVALAKSLMDA
ncbi:MAG: methyltransferase [Chloroflexi bacterium RBG_16_57_11]|nr:MAG: methyltransferase [Chloroflexi bacterium RBG_16_57_11]